MFNYACVTDSNAVYTENLQFDTDEECVMPGTVVFLGCNYQYHVECREGGRAITVMRKTCRPVHRVCHYLRDKNPVTDSATKREEPVVIHFRTLRKISGFLQDVPTSTSLCLCLCLHTLHIQEYS